MNAIDKKEAPASIVVIAFATVYLVWGSTYFFIQMAVHDIPPFIMGAMRFLIAGLLLVAWCLYKRLPLWNLRQIKVSAISGVLMLFVGNGAVIWAEQNIASSLAAVLISATPVWFVLLDKPKWTENLRSQATIIGLIIGFAGVILLFSERMSAALSTSADMVQIAGLIVLVIGSICWAGGSLISKYKSEGPGIVNTAWQLIASGMAFFVVSFLSNEWKTFKWQEVGTAAWSAVVYLIIMGSLAGYSAYVWLLQVKPATQVSTYAYVNPVVAVLLGVVFAGEHVTILQLTGLAIILTSVLLINIAKQRTEKRKKNMQPVMKAEAA